MLRTDGLYAGDSGRWSTCMLVRPDGTGVRGTVSFGVLRHEAARFLVKDTREFQLTRWEAASPPRERSRAQMTWVASEDGAEFKWTLKLVYDDGRSSTQPMADLGAVIEEGRLLRLRLRLAGNKLGTARDWHFYPIEQRAFGDDWGLEDDARLVRKRLESEEASREGVRLAAVLGYEAAAMVLGEAPVEPDRQRVVSTIIPLGGGAAVRAMLSLVWSEESQVRFNQNFAEDAPKGSAYDKAMLAIGKWLRSGQSKDQAKAKELAGKLDEYPEQVLQLIAVGQMQGAELEKALHEFLASFITKSEEQAFEAMKTTLLPWVLEGRERYG